MHLTSSLDESLSTTHGGSRVFVIIARYCAVAGELETVDHTETSDLQTVWQSDVLRFRNSIRTNGLSVRDLTSIVDSLWSYVYWSSVLGLAEWGMNLRAKGVMIGLFARGLSRGGLIEAKAEMAGLRPAT